MLATGLKHSKAGKAERKIRRLTKALGAVRELDVTLHLLSDLTQSDKHARTALEEVRAHVVAERDQRRERMLKRLGGVNASKLERRLASVAEAIERSQGDEWRTTLATRLLGRAKRLGAAIEEAGQMYAPEGLHNVRIAAKKLRYGLELAADGGVPGATPLLRPIRRVQDVLGRLHDLQILQTHVAAVQAGAEAERPGMHEALASLARHIEDECRHLHGRYLMSADTLCQACDVIRTKLVHEMQKPRSRRPLKMMLPRRSSAAASGGRR